MWANLGSKMKRLWATQRAMCAQAAKTSGGADSDTGDESESTGSVRSSYEVQEKHVRSVS